MASSQNPYARQRGAQHQQMGNYQQQQQQQQQPPGTMMAGAGGFGYQHHESHPPSSNVIGGGYPSNNIAGGTSNAAAQPQTNAFAADDIDWSAVPLDGGRSRSQQQGSVQQQQYAHGPASGNAAAAAAVPSTATRPATSTAVTGTAYNPYGGGGGGSSYHGQHHAPSASTALTDGAVIGGGTGTSGSSASAPIDLSNEQQQQQQEQGMSLQEQELKRQIEALQSQLTNKDEEIFNLQVSLSTVEAEASHRTEQTEKAAERRVRTAEDRLRLVQREADSARAKLAREQNKRNKGGGGGGISAGGFGGGVNQQQQQQQQQQHPAGQCKRDGNDADKADGKAGKGGRRVVTPPTATEESAVQTKAQGQSNQQLSEGISDGNIISIGLGNPSRSQRLASHLLLNLDILWPDDNDDAAAAAAEMTGATAMDDDKIATDSAELERPQPSKRRKKRGDGKGSSGSTSSGKESSAAPAATKALTRSNATNSGGAEAESRTTILAKQQEQQPPKDAEATTVNRSSSSSSNASSDDKAEVRALLTQIVSWQSGGGATPPPSVAVLVRDLIIKITSNFASVENAAAEALATRSGVRGSGTAQEPMEIDGDGPNETTTTTTGQESRPTNLSETCWPTVIHLFVVLREVLAFSSEARDVLRTWFSQTVDSNVAPSSWQDAGSIMSLSKMRSRIIGLGPASSKISDDVLVAAAVNTREALYSGWDGCGGDAGQSLSSATECWDWRSVEATCGKFRDLVACAILGEYSLDYASDDANRNGRRRFEEEACKVFLTLMGDAPSPASCDDLGVWSVWFDELLPTAFGVDQLSSTKGYDLIAILEDDSTLVRGFPRRRGKKKKFRALPDRMEGADNFVMEMKCRTLQNLLCLVCCCDETRNKIPLARRALAAILDEVEGSILPKMGGLSSEEYAEGRCLRACLQVVSYLSLLCRSKEGFELLRTQMMADCRNGSGRELASSGIAVMVDVLHCAVSHALQGSNELEHENSALWESLMTASMEFFQLVLFQITRIRLTEKAESDAVITLLSTVVERREMFLGCCHHVQDPAISFRRKLDSSTTTIADDLLTEISYDLDYEV